MGAKATAGFRQTVASCCRQLRPQEFLDAAVYLGAVFNALKAAIPGYTFLQFAEDLGFGRTNIISQYVHGHRRLTPKAARTVAQGLRLKESERRWLLDLVELRNAAAGAGRIEVLDRLRRQQADTPPAAARPELESFFSAWYHPVIREMTRLPGFKADAAWIAERLFPPIKPAEAQASLELLERLGLVKTDPASGRMEPAEAHFSTGHQVTSFGIMGFHLQMLRIAETALIETPAELRDFSSLTLALPPGSLALVKARLSQLAQELTALEQTGAAPAEVVQVNVQMFPVTAGDHQRDH